MKATTEQLPHDSSNKIPNALEVKSVSLSHVLVAFFHFSWPKCAQPFKRNWWHDSKTKTLANVIIKIILEYPLHNCFNLYKYRKKCYMVSITQLKFLKVTSSPFFHFKFSQKLSVCALWLHLCKLHISLKTTTLVFCTCKHIYEWQMFLIILIIQVWHFCSKLYRPLGTVNTPQTATLSEI